MGRRVLVTEKHVKYPDLYVPCGRDSSSLDIIHGVKKRQVDYFCRAVTKISKGALTFILEQFGGSKNAGCGGDSVEQACCGAARRGEEVPETVTRMERERLQAIPAFRQAWLNVGKARTMEDTVAVYDVTTKMTDDEFMSKLRMQNDW